MCRKKTDRIMSPLGMTSRTKATKDSKRYWRLNLGLRGLYLRVGILFDARLAFAPCKEVIGCLSDIL